MQPKRAYAPELYSDILRQATGQTDDRLRACRGMGGDIHDGREGETRMRQKLVIWGAASQAKIVADIIRLRDEYDILGFLDSISPERKGSAFCGASILGGEETLDGLRQRGVDHLICAFADNRGRLRLAAAARARGFMLASAIHPATIIARGVPVGAGTVIHAGAVVNPGATLGENVVVATRSE